MLKPGVRGAADPAGGAATLGVLYMIGFCVVGPMIDVFAKLAAQTVPVGVIALARFAVQSALLGAMVVALRRPLPPPRDLPGHALRGALIAGATLLFFAALRHMPVADAIAVFFVEPLVLTLLSAVLLSEPVGWRRVVGCVIGFGGALLVVQPSFEALGAPALYPLGTAVLFAFYMILTRTLSQRGDVVSMQFAAGVAGAVVVGAALWAGDGSGSIHFDPVRPRGGEWALLAGVGVAATFSHLLVVLALRHAPASVIAPVQYMEIAAATLFGLVVFGDFPDALKWLGIAIVAGSGLYVLHRERRAQVRLARAGSR